MHSYMIFCVIAAGVLASHGYATSHSMPSLRVFPGEAGARREGVASMQCLPDRRPCAQDTLLSRPFEKERSDMPLIRLERRVRVLERALSDVCGALVQCDDLALLERETAGMGDVFMDTSFNASRSPRYLRRCVRDIMRDAGLEPTPLMYSWVPVKRQYK